MTDQTPDAPPLAKRLIIGDPLTTEQVDEQLLPKRRALPIFASDALSSVAYAPQHPASRLRRHTETASMRTSAA